MLKLNTEIEDSVTRENMIKIQTEFDQNPLLGGSFRALTNTFRGAGTFQIAHGLEFQPRDIFISWKTGAGNATINYDKVDRTYITVTTTGPCVVRFLVGAAGGE